ncbi:hypothetical protein C8Q73DRAFT_637871 [Cubamyces lactineus]|nr:hypothetical protein C8Q73DRAFT_637871 [Cubamyces lactineus]
MVISNDLAALVGFASEAVLWGINFVLYTASLVLLLRRARSCGLNVPILVLGCALFASCTAHFALEFSHFFVTLRDTGVDGYANETEPLVVADILISLTDLIGDVVLVYRCWIVWERNYWIVLLPFLTTIAGFSCIAEVVHLVVTIDPTAPVAPPALVPLGFAGYALPLVTNVLSTFLIVVRLWDTARAADARYGGRMAGTARVAQTAVAIIVESGALYLAAQLVLVVLFALEHPAQAIVAVMAVQIYGIAPTLIVLRVALGISSDFTTRGAPVAPADACAATPAINTDHCADISWDMHMRRRQSADVCLSGGPYGAHAPRISFPSYGGGPAADAERARGPGFGMSMRYSGLGLTTNPNPNPRPHSGHLTTYPGNAPSFVETEDSEPTVGRVEGPEYWEMKTLGIEEDEPASAV